MLHLKRRRTSADSHHLYCILPYHGNAARGGKVQRKHSPGIFQKHDALSGNTAGRVIMLRRTERPERLAGIHGSTENQPEHPADLVIKNLHGSLTAAQPCKIRVCEIIGVISI